MNVTSDKINFTSRANVELSSIKKYMPEQLRNLIMVPIDFAQNGHSNDVFIKAVSNDALKMVVSDAEGKKTTTNVVDIRKMFALVTHQLSENFYKRSEGGIAPETQLELNHQFNKSIEAINRNPYDFRGAILREYNNLVKG